MAGRIAGITIEIGGNTKPLQKALKGVDTQLKATQNNLKDINKLLKLDPKNTELLTQKQKNLESSIDLTKKRLQELKDAQGQVAANTPEWDALQREIIATEQDLAALKKEYKDFGNVASQQLKAVGKSLQDAGGKVQEFGRKLAPISGAATAIGTGLLKLGYDAVTGADDLNTLAKQTGFTTEEIQKMRYAADLIDVSFEDISGALRKFKQKVDPANGSLAALGVSVLDADGNLRNSTDVFNDAIVALSGISNETERDQIAMDLFGKSADSLAGIIDDGGAALKAYGDQAEELGLILDQDTLDKLNETNDTIDQMKAQISGTMAVIGTKVVPVIAPLLTKVADLIVKVSDALGKLTPEQTETILKVTALVAALSPVLMIGGQLISGIGALVTGIGAVVGVLGGPLTIAIGAAVAAGVLIWKNWDRVKNSAANLKKEVSNAWNGIKTAVSNVATSLSNKINAVKTKFDELKTKVSTVVSNIKSALSFDWQLPRIKIPHLVILDKGELPYGIGGFGRPPELDIQWYRKAYENPVVFTRPTVLQTPSGLMGFGDGHGAEIVMGLDKLREVVGSSRGNVVINVYPSAGMDVNALADKIQQKFVAAANQRRAVYA